ncbi:HEAT repeat-containing protein 1 [Entamoeba marina]
MSISSQLNKFVTTVDVNKIVSYMYDKTKAKFIDRSTLYHNAVDSLNVLFKNSELLQTWKDTLFNDKSIECNRDMLTDKQNKDLTKEIRCFLPYLSPHFLNSHCDSIIEYMIRVYAINIIDADTLIMAFIPYYSTENFLKLVSLSDLTLLNELKNQNRVVRKDFVIHLSQNPSTLTQFFDFYISNNSLIYNIRYTTFITTVIVQISQDQLLNEHTLTALLSIVLQLLKSSHSKLIVVGLAISSQLLSVHSLPESKIVSFLNVLQQRTSMSNPEKFIAVLCIACKYQQHLKIFPTSVQSYLVNSTNNVHSAISNMHKHEYDTTHFITASTLFIDFFTELVHDVSFNELQIKDIIHYVFSLCTTDKVEIDKSYYLLIQTIDLRFPNEFNKALDNYFSQDKPSNENLASQLKTVLPTSLNIPLYDKNCYVGTFATVKDTSLVDANSISRIIMMLRSDKQVHFVKDKLVNMLNQALKFDHYLLLFKDKNFEKLRTALSADVVLNHLMIYGKSLPNPIIFKLFEYIAFTETPLQEITSLYGEFFPSKTNTYQTLDMFSNYLNQLCNIDPLFEIKDVGGQLSKKISLLLKEKSVNFASIKTVYFEVLSIMAQYLNLENLKTMQFDSNSAKFIVIILLSLLEGNYTQQLNKQTSRILSYALDNVNLKNAVYHDSITSQQILTHTLLYSYALKNELATCYCCLIVKLSKNSVVDFLPQLLLFPYSSINVAYNQNNSGIPTYDMSLNLITTPHYIHFIKENINNFKDTELNLLYTNHFVALMTMLFDETHKNRLSSMDSMLELIDIVNEKDSQFTFNTSPVELNKDVFKSFIKNVSTSRIELTSSNKFFSTFCDTFMKSIQSDQKEALILHVINVMKNITTIDVQKKFELIKAFGMRSVKIVLATMELLDIYKDSMNDKNINDIHLVLINGFLTSDVVGRFAGNEELFNKLLILLSKCSGDNILNFCTNLNSTLWSMLNHSLQQQILKTISIDFKEKRTEIVSAMNLVFTQPPFELVIDVITSFFNKIKGLEPVDTQQKSNPFEISLEVSMADVSTMELEIPEQQSNVQINEEMLKEYQFIAFSLECFFKKQRFTASGITFEDETYVELLCNVVQQLVLLLQHSLDHSKTYHNEYLVNIELNSLTFLVTFISKYLSHFVQKDTSSNKSDAFATLASQKIDVLHVIDIIYEVVGNFGTIPAIYNVAIGLLSHMIAIFPKVFVGNSDRFVRALTKEDVVGVVVQKLIPHVVNSLSTAKNLPSTSIIELFNLLHLFNETKVSEEHLAGILVLLLDAQDTAALPFMYEVLRSIENEKLIKNLHHNYSTKTAGVFNGYEQRMTNKDIGQKCIDFVNGQIKRREYIAKCMKTGDDVGIQQSYTTFFKKVTEVLNIFDSSMEEESTSISDSLHDMVDNIADLFNITTLIRAVVYLIKQSGIKVKRTALMILNSKLTDLSVEDMHVYESSFLDAENGLIHVVIKILESVDQLSSKQVDIEAEQGTIQTAVLLLEILLRFYGAQHEKEFMELLPYVIKCIQIEDKLANVKIVTSSLLCLSIYASELTEPLTSHLPELVPYFVNLLPGDKTVSNTLSESDSDNTNSLISSLMSCILVFTKSYKNVLHPYVDSFLPIILQSHYTTNPVILPAIMELMNVIATSLDLRLVLSLVERHFKNENLRNNLSLSALFTCLSNSLSQISTIQSIRVKLYQFLFDSLETIPTIASPLEMKHCISSYVQVFNTLVLKLSDDTFKPFFLKCAENFNVVVADSKIPDIYLYTQLFMSFSRTLKSIFVPYFGSILNNILAVLSQLPFTLASTLIPQRNSLTKRSVDSNKNKADTTLILQTIHCNVELLQTLFINDKTNFVDSQKIEMLLPIVNLLDSMHNCYDDDDDYFDLVTKTLSPCFCQFALCVPNQVCWKPLNHQLLIQTQHTDSNVRLASLHCMTHLWDNLAADMVYLIPETLPYLTDLMEDTVQDVCEASREFAGIIQKHLGADALDKYLN